MCFGSRPPFVFMSLCAFVLFHSLGVRKEEVRDHLCYSTVVLQALDVSTLAPSPQSVGLFVCTVYLVSVCVCVCVWHCRYHLYSKFWGFVLVLCVRFARTRLYHILWLPLSSPMVARRGR